MRTVWINRSGHAPPAEIRPDGVIEDLHGLADVLDAWR